MAVVGSRSRMLTINSVAVVLGLLLVMAQQSMQMRLITPVTEFTPVTPVTEFTPATPVTEFTPVTPVTEFTPATPVTEFTPVTPVTEFTPVTPVAEFTPVTEFTDNCRIELVRLGLVFSSSSSERALQESGLFKPDKETPHVDIAGRRFHLGSLNGRPIVCVNTGSRSINAATAAQIMMQRFRIFGIIYFGNGGSLNEDRLVPGDVAVPNLFAYTGAWEWQKFEGESSSLRAANELVFGEFNYPQNGKNKLATVIYDKLQLHANGEQAKDVFWLQASQSWLKVAANALKNLKLRQCYMDVCLPHKPKVAFGMRGSSSDIYVKNKAYAEFLSNAFNASVVDQESAAVGLTCLSNGKQFIVFRGISNVPGSVDSNSRLSYLATYNGFLATAKFIDSVPTPRIACQ